MRITKLESRTIEEAVTHEILCNKCAKSILHVDYTDDQGKMHFSAYGITEYTYKGGYGSDPLEDTTSYTFSLCEPCLADMFKSFLIPVDVSEYHIMDGTVYRNDERQEKFNQIHACKDPSELANYLLDEDQTVRGYAKIRVEQLETK